MSTSSRRSNSRKCQHQPAGLVPRRVAKPPQPPLAEHIVQADSIHAVPDLLARAVHVGMIGLGQVPSLSWGRSPSRQNGSAGPNPNGGNSLVFANKVAGSRASYVAEGDQGAGPQVLRDPRPSAQLQNRQPQRASLEPPAAQAKFVDVLVEVHPGAGRQKRLIGVQGRVHTRDGHTPTRQCFYLCGERLSVVTPPKVRPKKQNDAILDQGT